LKDSKKVKLISGDLDKAEEKLVQYYKENGINVVKENDENITDF